MKKPRIILNPLLVFILAQLAWLSLVGIVIYLYLSNYLFIKDLNQKIFPENIAEKSNIIAFVLGLVMLVFVLASMYFVFIYLTRQININRMYDDFVANISHELKSPLASIQLYLETLRLRDVPPEKKKMFYDLMGKDADRLKKLIDSILDISIIEQKKLAYHFQVYPAQKLFEDLARQSADQLNIPGSGLNFEGGLAEKCVADRKMLGMVVDNLFDNAMKYRAGDFYMSVSFHNDGRWLFVEFTDKGIGIPEVDLKLIFKKFYRTQLKNMPNIRGTGLGLYMVREIVKSHGGNIEAISPGENKGSTFRISLPIYGKTKKDFHRKMLGV